MAAHQKRYDDWKAEKAKGGGAPAMPGGLLPAFPTGPMPKRRRRKTTGPQQKQVDHPWAYLVGWYEEIRRHTGVTFSIQRIEFQAIKAWRELFEVETEPWEIGVLLQLDYAWMSVLPKEGKKPKE